MTTIKHAFDGFTEHARELLGKGEDWSVYKAEAVDVAGTDGAFRLTGGFSRELKSGPRKGERTWKGCGGEAEVIVLRKDHHAWRDAKGYVFR